MKKPLRVLMVEDVEDDARLVLRELRRAGFEPTFTRVASRTELKRELGAAWDVVLCDYSMPGFSGIEALAIIREMKLDLPFIIVSGTVGEARAVEIMRAGANDYVFKDNLQRLAAVIERELREAENRHERRKLQEQLLLSERMASIGVVAAGVVHEINNPLLALLGSAELAVRTLETDKGLDGGRAIREELDRVLEAAERLGQIVADVRLFSHAGVDPIASVDVQAALSSSVRLALHEIFGRCEVITDYQETPLVALPASRLGQVFLNLLLNAAQAIPPGDATHNHIRLSTRTDADGWALIEITDSGAGIPEELQKTIFDPFVTTKAAGSGTGLGLFITHRIVTDAGGRIEFESHEGRGSTFRVLLPASNRASVEPKQTKSIRLGRSSRRAPQQGRSYLSGHLPALCAIPGHTRLRHLSIGG